MPVTGTHLTMGCFCSVRIYKLHLESPLRLCHVGVCCVMSCHVMSRHVMSSLLLQLLCKPGENKRVCSSYGSLQFSSSLLGHALPTIGSVSHAHSEIQQETQLNCISDKQLLGEVYKHAKYHMGHTSTINYSLFSRSSNFTYCPILLFIKSGRSTYSGNM